MCYNVSTITLDDIIAEAAGKLFPNKSTVKIYMDIKVKNFTGGKAMRIVKVIGIILSSTVAAAAVLGIIFFALQRKKD